MIGFACVCISEVVKYVRTKEELIMSTTVNKKDLAAKLVAEYDLSKKGLNPATGEKIEVPASKAVKFKASKSLKDAVK